MTSCCSSTTTSAQAGSSRSTKTLDHQVVVLGLVSSKNPVVESDDQLVDRIRQAARWFGLERLAISCQCGFASTAGGNKVTPQIQREKLELVGRTAERMWG